MAVRVLSATQAYSAPTAADTATNVMTQHATTNITISTTNLFTATFTAANIGDLCTGVLLYITAVGTGGTTTVTLQENTVDVACTASITTTSLQATGWVYFRAVAPFAFTATTAGYYRWKVVNSGATGTTSGGANAAGTALSYITTDNRNTTTTPGTTDDIINIGQNLAAVTLTLDGTQVLGSGTNTNAAGASSLVSMRCNTGTHAIDNCYNATIDIDTAASVDVTYMGNIVNRVGASFLAGTSGVPYPAAQTANFHIEQNGTSGQFGVFNVGTMQLFGAPKTSTTLYKTTYASGVGTAADPLIVADAVDWVVGDEILVEASSTSATNYDECEKKFIKTKNSTTSYVISDTKAGAEAALTYTHTAAKIFNVERNILFDTTDITEFQFINNYSLVTGGFNLQWVRCETLGTTANFKSGLTLCGVASSEGAADYCVSYRAFRNGFYWATTQTPHAHSGLIVCNSKGIKANVYGAFYGQIKPNLTLTDCHAINEDRIAYYLDTCANVDFNSCTLNSCNQDSTTANGSIYLLTTFNTMFNNCTGHCNRNHLHVPNGTQVEFNSCDFTNNAVATGSIIAPTAGGYTDTTFNYCDFGATSIISGYLTMAPGSEIKFQNANNDATGLNNFWYTAYGSAHTCFTGLTDTTITAAGHPTVGIYPEDATTGFTWSFKVPVFEGFSGSFLALLQRNATFSSGDVTVKLYLPGSTTADATYTMSTVTGAWETAIGGKSYTGTVDGLATVVINAKTATAGAYLYVGDLFGGTNQVTNLNVWSGGKPSPVMFDQIGNPASVWAVLASTQTTTGTMGIQAVQTRNLTGLIPATL